MPEPKDKLDTSVNGPAGLYPVFDGDAWENVDWPRREEEVRRLRGRIFKAVREGDWPLVRSLQKLMLRSWSNTLVSVRQVTQRNAGRRTAGIDGLVALTSVLLQLRSISFCTFLASGQSPSRTALKILPRSRRTCPS